MKKEFSLEKDFRVWSRSEVTWSWQGFENDEPLGRGNEDDFPGGKATEPLQKEKQSKNQINQKKKKRAKIQAVTTLTPLKKSRPRDSIAQGTSMTWGHRFQLGYPCSFIYCSPKKSITSTYLAVEWSCFTFPKFWLVFAHIPIPFYWHWFSIPVVISNGSEHKFSFGHENLFTSVMGLLQINAGLLVSINAEN